MDENNSNRAECVGVCGCIVLCSVGCTFGSYRLTSRATWPVLACVSRGATGTRGTWGTRWTGGSSLALVTLMKNKTEE